MTELIKQLRKLLPGITYTEGESFYWSPKQQTIIYRLDDDSEAAQWALLHESSHALLRHHNYNTDLELLLLEVAAWEKAKSVGHGLGVTINEEHIQDCLDTYRDWLHQRSTCPRCSVVSLQVNNREYLCHNCDARWQVSASRFCRPYRKLETSKEQSETSKEQFPSSETTFQ